MIVKEEFLKKIRSSFDLNIYEAKIWTALLSKGVATAGELADISGVPRSRSYDVLESLEKRGFVIMKIGKPIKYLAVEPKEVIKRVRKSIELSASTKVDMVNNVKSTDTYTDLVALFKGGIEHVDPTSISGALRGRENINNQIETLLRNAKSSVTIVTSEDGFVRKMNNYGRILKTLAKNKVKIRIAAPMNDEGKKLAKSLNGLDVRKLDKESSRFIIIDNKEVVFMVSSDKEVHESYDTGIWVNTPYFANTLNTLFDSQWKGLAKVR